MTLRARHSLITGEMKLRNARARAATDAAISNDVSNPGTAMAIAAGTATITAAAGTVSGSPTLTGSLTTTRTFQSSTGQCGAIQWHSSDCRRGWIQRRLGPCRGLQSYGGLVQLHREPEHRSSTRLRFWLRTDFPNPSFSFSFMFFPARRRMPGSFRRVPKLEIRP